jgi:hypothetical protein
MDKKDKLPPLTPAEINDAIEAANGLIEKFAPHLAESAHLINSVGALRTVVMCLGNHMEAAKPAAVPAAQ